MVRFYFYFFTRVESMSISLISLSFVTESWCWLWIYFINADSLFSTNPEIQEKNFPQMGVNDLQRLREHGTGVLRDVEMMVTYVKAEDDQRLIDKIHKVNLIRLN